MIISHFFLEKRVIKQPIELDQIQTAEILTGSE